MSKKTSSFTQMLLIVLKITQHFFLYMKNLEITIRFSILIKYPERTKNSY